MIILASASPRRQALLRQIGVRFRQQVAEVDETPLDNESAQDYVVRLAVDANNDIYIRKTGSSAIQFAYIAASTSETYSESGMTSTDWINAAITWSSSVDQVKFFLDGAQVGSTQTGLGTWAGSLASTLCNIGASDNSGSDPWCGWLAHVALWDKVLTPNQVLWSSKENKP